MLCPVWSGVGDSKTYGHFGFVRCFVLFGLGWEILRPTVIWSGWEILRPTVILDL